MYHKNFIIEMIGLLKVRNASLFIKREFRISYFIKEKASQNDIPHKKKTEIPTSMLFIRYGKLDSAMKLLTSINIDYFDTYLEIYFMLV
ncbi:hypothetical protein PcaKH35_03470 [Parageobacillus caldoxylosilyticus]|nr:hypothetical protein PcaKH35_03470 [Parageobacillus caldoxylosilyticus]